MESIGNHIIDLRERYHDDRRRKSKKMGRGHVFGGVKKIPFEKWEFWQIFGIFHKSLKIMKNAKNLPKFPFFKWSYFFIYMRYDIDIGMKKHLKT